MKQILRLLTRKYRHTLAALLNSAVIVVSLTAALLLRFDFTIPAPERLMLYRTLLPAVVIKLVSNRIAGVDRNWSLKSFGLRELERLTIANCLGSLGLAGLIFAGFDKGFSRSVIVIDLLTCLWLGAALRASVRMYRESWRRSRPVQRVKGILIYGAGEAGRTVLRELQGNPGLGYQVLGFLDDDHRKRHFHVAGVPVVGSGRDAARIVSRLRNNRTAVGEILVAMPSVTGAAKREALANCRAAGIPFKIVPGVGELISGRVLTSQIREVSVLDLLGREPVQLDAALIRETLANRNVLVTGGAGSIGSEICRQIARFNPAVIIALDQAETEMYNLELEFRDKFPSINLVPRIADIRDSERIDEVIREHRIHSIFHAAAYKHVPMMESHLTEAVKNNVFGTWNLVRAAYRNGVSSFLMISSDKAVNPTNLMGMTKRVAELIVASMPVPRSETRPKFISVRFGNVLGSNGSVIPLFRQQISAGGPVTVTHPEMRRYFMTIPEAVQLVLEASTMGKGSEIFELDMGEPVRILDLARNMIRLSGHEPDEDIEIRFTGIRPGEKLFEELALTAEQMQPTRHEKIKVVCFVPPSHSRIRDWLHELEDLVRANRPSAILQHLVTLVPEYQPAGAWADCLSRDAEHYALAAAGNE